MAIDTNKLNSNLSARMQTRKAANQPAVSEQTTSKPEASKAQKSDSVVITAQAQQLQKMQTKLSLMSDVDQKKVSEIKQAISEGRYSIDPQKLAKNISSFESELNDLYKDNQDSVSE
ncbi:flagellar biosynthesis anti-sigma factor FlgM [Shewanella sp. OPT22]|nr:flagellar biosynthesis anti-sigma factor FlgM [Shewanella sp. OPT22]